MAFGITLRPGFKSQLQGFLALHATLGLRLSLSEPSFPLVTVEEIRRPSKRAVVLIKP